MVDYNEIIIEGFGNPNTREFLSDFLKRKYEELKANHYSLDEFYNGCSSVVEKHKGFLMDNFEEKVSKLKEQLKDAKNKTGLYSPNKHIYSEEERLLVLPKLRRMVNEPIKYLSIKIGNLDGTRSRDFTAEDLAKVEEAINTAKGISTKQDEKTNKVKIDKNKHNLKIRQIALKYFYEEISITEQNAMEMLTPYGFTAGKKLLQCYNDFNKVSERIGDPESFIKLKNRIANFEKVLPLLNGKGRERAEKELEQLYRILVKY